MHLPSRKPAIRAVAVAAAALAMAACTPIVTTHGHALNPDQIAEIKPGVTTREEVTRLLGSPSTIGTFEHERWFYVSQRNEVMSFYKADVTQQDVVGIDFDSNGVVSDVHTHGLELAQAIEPDPNKTRTMGNEITLLQQFLGNIGKFNSSPEAGAGVPRVPGR
jgi:outer membrane protein assembly factor BamE (lipoprotein component of BamABCDE complex)